MKVNGNAIRGTVVATLDDSFAVRDYSGQYYAWLLAGNGREVVRGSDKCPKLTRARIPHPAIGDEVLVLRCTRMDGVVRLWTCAQMYDRLL